MSDVPAPNLSDANAPLVRHGFALFIRGVIYALAFWSVYRGMLLVYPLSSTNTDQDEKVHQRQMATYDEQTQQASRMMVEAEKQQVRMGAVITKQEEQAKRFDAILDRWEKQTGLRK